MNGDVRGRQWLIPAVVGVIAGCWQSHQHYPTGLFDLYPLRAGALALLHTGNAYQFRGVVPAHDLSYNVARVGNVYPVTANLLAFPLLLVSPALGGAIYTGLCAALAVRLAAAAGWGPASLLFYPALISLGIEQTETIVVIAAGAAVYLRGRDGCGWRWAAALTVASIKPTVAGPLILLELARGRRHSWRAIAAIVGLLAVAFAVEPSWLAAWVHTARAREAGQGPGWPLAVPAVLAACWGDWTLAAVLVTFTYTAYSPLGVYQLAPLLLGLDRRRAALMSACGAGYYLVFAFVPGLVSAGLLLVVPRVLLASPRTRAWIAARPRLGVWRIADLPFPWSHAHRDAPVQTISHHGVVASGPAVIPVTDPAPATTRASISGAEPAPTG